jgi:hypothetical protein
MAQDQGDDEATEESGGKGIWQIFLPGKAASEGAWDADNASWLSARGPAGRHK